MMATAVVPRWDIALVMAVTGTVIWQAHDHYQKCAPPLSALRNAPRDDLALRQQLLDADVMVGSLVAVTTGLAVAATRRLSLAFLLPLGFAVVSGWHHRILWERNAGEARTIWGN